MGYDCCILPYHSDNNGVKTDVSDVIIKTGQSKYKLINNQ